MTDVAGTDGENTVTGARQLTQPGRRAVGLALGMRKVLLDEMARAGDDNRVRLQSEMELLADVVARMASAHRFMRLPLRSAIAASSVPRHFVARASGC